MGARNPMEFEYNEVLSECLLRNFGGLPFDGDEMKTARYHFLGADHWVQPVPAIELIRQNLDDRDARHLLVATTAGSALQILEGDIRRQDRPLTVIHGSQFKDDQSPDYSYRILSQIILCMERGGFVVLRSMDRIYGSLYDMLNQNYTTVGGKRNCRVALGADSNPMCQVADDFRCIVIMDSNEVTDKDPPFLNRFEKQCISYEDILQDRPRTRKLIAELDEWVQNVATVMDKDTETLFTPADAFLGFHDNTLPSLVLHVLGQDGPDEWDRTTAQQCKELLLWTAAEDAIVRIRETELGDKEDIATWCEDVFYNKQKHGGLQDLLEWKVQSPSPNASTIVDMEVEPEPEDDSADAASHHAADSSPGMKLVVMTFTSVYENPEPFARKAGLAFKQVPSLGAYKSETEFAQRMDEFWKDDKLNLFILQVNAATDANHVVLAKSSIEEKWTEHHKKPGAKPKHVCIMIHVDREPAADEASWQFNFLSSWDQVTLDSLAPREVEIRQLRTQALDDAFKLQHVEDVLREEVSTCLYDIGYPAGSKAAEHIRTMVELMTASNDYAANFIVNLKVRVIEWLSSDATHRESLWVQRLACNRRYLTESTTLANAVVRHMRSKVREPLAMLLFKLEDLDTLRTYFQLENVGKRELCVQWLELVCDSVTTDISHLKEGETGRSLLGYNLTRTLTFPFSKYFFQRAEMFRDMFLADIRDLEQREDDSAYLHDLKTELGPKYCGLIKDRVPEMGEDWFMDNVEMYFKDFCALAQLGQDVPDRFETAQKLFQRQDKDSMQTPMAVHVCFWRFGQEIEQELRMMSTLAADVHSLDEQRAIIRAVLHQRDEGTGDQLLQRVCLHYLEQVRTEQPSASIADWHRSVYKIVADFPSSTPLPAFQLLRLSDEFVRILCIDGRRTEWPRELPQLLNASASPEMEDFFTNEDCFMRVCNLVLGMEASDAVVAKPLQQFRLEFANRSLSELQRLDSTNIQHVLQALLLPQPPEMVASGEPEPEEDTMEPQPEPDMEPEVESEVAKDLQPPPFLNKVIGDFIRGEKADFVELLLHQELPTERLKVLDACLANAEAAAGRPDSFASTLVLDVVEDEYFAFDPWIDSEEELEIDEVVRCIQAASGKFSLTSAPLHRITATAFFRTILRQLASDLENQTSEDLLRSVNAVMDKNEPMVESLRNYFLKQYRLAAGLTIPDLQAVCSEDGPETRRLPWLKRFQWSTRAETDPGLGFSPFMYCELFSEVHNALRRFIDYKDDRVLDTIVDKCIGGSPRAVAHRIALLSAFATCFLFPSVKRDLDRKESVAAKGLIDLSRSDDGKFGPLPAVFRNVMRKIINGDLLAVMGAAPFSPELPAAARLKASVVLNAIVTAASMENSVLTSYVSKPKVVARHYILSMPESEEAMVMSALAQGDKNGAGQHTKYVRYQCPCGFKYMVGECGKTMQVSKCPSCKNDIGGQDHKELPGQKKLDAQLGGYVASDETGFIEAPNDFRQVGVPTRSMLPASACILDLIVHACLGASQDCAERRDVDALVNGRVTSIALHCQKHVDACFRKLKMLLNDCTDEEAAICLHAIIAELPSFEQHQDDRVLETAAKRNAWEADFQTELVAPKVASNLASTVRDFRETVFDVQEAIQARTTELELTIAELDSPAPHACRVHLPRFFRVRAPLTFDSLMAQFTSDGAAIRSFPYLELFFEFEEQLAAISYTQVSFKDGVKSSELMNNMLPLVQWTNLVSERGGHRIDQAKAAEMTAEEFIKEHFSGPETAAAQQTFENFEQSWNALRKQKWLQNPDGTAMQLRCQELPDSGIMPKMTKDAPIKLSCLDVSTGQNAWVYLAVHKLASVQNEYLEKAVRAAAQPGCTGALRFFQSAEGQDADNTVGRSACNVTDAQKVLRDELVHYERRDEHVMHGENDLEYGRGMQLRYNYPKLELLLAKNYLFGCMHIDAEIDTMKPFSYSDAGDDDKYSVLEELAGIVPQETIPKSSINRILDSPLMATDERKTKALESLLLVARSLTRQYTDGDRPDKDKMLVKYVEEWMARQIDRSMLETFQRTFINALPIANLVALHDDIESSMTQKLIDAGTQIQYKKDLTDEAIQELDMAVGADPKREPKLASAGDRELININDLMKALRRFTVRYLDKEDFCRPDQPLAHMMAMPSRWPSCEFKSRMNAPIDDAADLGDGTPETHWSKWTEMVDPAFDEPQHQTPFSPFCKAVLVEHAYEALEYLHNLQKEHGTAADAADLSSVSRTRAQGKGRGKGRGRGGGRARGGFKD